jgi:Spy/CpxP family protein refolding chaperone
MLSRFRVLGALAVLSCASAIHAQPGKQPGGGGGFQPPRAGDILAGFLQDMLKLDADQKKQLGELQKDVDAKLAKILNDEQKKSLENMRTGKGFGFGPPGFGPPGGGGPGGNPPGGTPGGPPPKMGFGGPGFGGFGFSTPDNAQKKIGATDEEWKVIGPKLQKVTAARRAASGEAGPGTAVAQAQAELKAVLDDPKHAKADVEEKIAAVRKAREQARADLADAQRDLIRLLTPAQQAMMVGLGHLD